MKRIHIPPLLLALPFGGLLLPSAQPPPSCPNLIAHEPIVIYDVSGGTLGGLFDRSLTVYADGTARLTSFTPNFGPSRAELVFVGADAAQQLLQDLGLAGAGSLCDSPVNVADLPPATLTVMRGTPDSAAHTFSWFLDEGPYGVISQRIQTFITANFPNF